MHARKIIVRLALGRSREPACFPENAIISVKAAPGKGLGPLSQHRSLLAWAPYRLQSRGVEM